MAGPGGVEVGRASIRVLPDTSNFSPALKRYLERIENTTRLNLSATVDASKLVASASEAVKAAEAAVESIDVDIDVDASELVANAAGAVQAAESAVENIDVDLDVDASKIVGEVAKAVQTAEAAAPEVDVEIDIDPSTLIGKARLAVAMAQKVAGDIDVKMNIKGGAAMAGLGAIALASGVAVRSFARGALQATATTLTLAAAAGAATVAVAGLAAPLVAVASAAASAVVPIAALGAALVPAAIGAAGLAVGVLAASFNGLGAAIDDTDPAKAAEALAKLPPAAQEGALALRELKTQFSDLGEGIQQNFWANLSNIGDLAALVEPISAATKGLAVDMGNAAAGVVAFVSKGTGLSAMTTLLDNGSAAAGWLLGAALLLGLLGLLWTGWRAAGMLRAPLGAPATAASPEEDALLTLLRQHERALPPAAADALHATVIATRDALRATAGETALSRAAFDAQQAAREDLPDLLAAYRALPSDPQQDAELLGQLARIETRMAHVTREQAQAGQRALRAHGQYLDDKYRTDAES